MSDRDSKPRHPLLPHFFILFGTGLLLGAFIAFTRHASPIFMPSQLDAFYGLFKWLFGVTAGLNIGGAILTVLGGLCVIGGVAPRPIARIPDQQHECSLE
jgi:hypothetical protein